VATTCQGAARGRHAVCTGRVRHAVGWGVWQWRRPCLGRMPRKGVVHWLPGGAGIGYAGTPHVRLVSLRPLNLVVAVVVAGLCWGTSDVDDPVTRQAAQPSHYDVTAPICDPPSYPM
jgi:hypothetical protein